MAKHDNRNNNVERLEKMKQNTEHNIEAAQEALSHTKMTDRDKQETMEKNKRREQSIQAFDAEIQDERTAREQGYPK